VVCGSCGGEEITGVRLVITTDIATPTIDRVDVTILGSPTTGAEDLCQPSVVPFEIAEGSGFPIELLVDKGTQYVGWVAFRVEGSAGGVVVHRREMLVRWPSSDVIDVPVKLEQACADLAVPCPEVTQECIAGLCVGTPSPGIFDDPARIDPAAPACFESR
jgi:hypothetical protein